jgi:hypothetical protein
MTEQKDHLLIAWWAKNLDELDREIARLSLVCRVRILDRGVIARVLHNDASVCGRDNPLAFAKLRNLLIMHFAIREKSADALGQVQTAAIEQDIIDRLTKSFPDLGEGEWPPA